MHLQLASTQLRNEEQEKKAEYLLERRRELEEDWLTGPSRRSKVVSQSLVQSVAVSTKRVSAACRGSMFVSFLLCHGAKGADRRLHLCSPCCRGFSGLTQGASRVKST